MPRARLDVIHAIHRPQVERIGRQPVERVRWHAQHFACSNLIGGVLYQRTLRGLTIDFYDFGAHGLPFLPCFLLESLPVKLIIIRQTAARRGLAYHALTISRMKNRSPTSGAAPALLPLQSWATMRPGSGSFPRKLRERGRTSPMQRNVRRTPASAPPIIRGNGTNAPRRSLAPPPH